MPLTQVSSRLIEDTLRYVLGSIGSVAYTFTGKGLNGTVTDPTLTLSRGHTYVFENRNANGAHPFYIKTSLANGGTNDAYNTGVTNNGGAGGTEIVFTVPHDAPDLLYYQCSSHSSMNGQLKIAGAVADGSITEAKLADDAVTADKLANSINTAIAANTAKDLTALSASNLTSGTVPDARFPATLPAISGVNLTNLPANRVNRNLIINGAMQVAQRGTSSTSTGYQTCDRIQAARGGGAITQAQVDISSSDTPYSLGFRKAFKVTNSTAASAAGNYRDIRYYVEAQDIANSGWNLASSSSNITLSFWVKSSVAQTFYFFIYVPDSSKHYVTSFTLSANTWTKVTKTIPGASGLSVNNDNGNGLNIQIAMWYGSNFTTSGQAVDTWGTWDGSSRVPDMTSTWAATTNATFELTGLQLEVGNSSTDFEHLSIADTLAKCQRYFHTLGLNGTAVGHSTTYYWFFPISTTSPHYRRCRINFPVTMRTTPTVTNAAGNNNGVGGTPTGTQHGDVNHITFHWDGTSGGHLVELTAADFSAEL